MRTPLPPWWAGSGGGWGCWRRRAGPGGRVGESTHSEIRYEYWSMTQLCISEPPLGGGGGGGRRGRRTPPLPEWTATSGRAPCARQAVAAQVDIGAKFERGSSYSASSAESKCRQAGIRPGSSWVQPALGISTFCLQTFRQFGFFRSNGMLKIWALSRVSACFSGLSERV